MRIVPVLIFALLLAACSNDTRTAGGVTKAEADALDDAAAMVEEQRLPADTVVSSQAAAEPVKE